MGKSNELKDLELMQLLNENLGVQSMRLDVLSKALMTHSKRITELEKIIAQDNCCCKEKK